MAVIDHEVERAWRTLDSRASRVDHLRAVWVAARSIEAPMDEHYVRLQALIRSHDATVIRAIESALLHARRCTGSSLPPPPPAFLNDLRTRLRASDPMDRLVAIQECLQNESFGGAALLAERIEAEGNAMALVVLAKALGILGGEKFLGYLEGIAQHPMAAVRAGAIEGLRHLPSERALRILLDRLADEDEQVRRLAHEGLASSDPDRLVGYLRALHPTSTPPWLLPVLEVLSPWRLDDEVTDLLARLEAWDDDDVSERAEELREVSRPSREELSSWA
jgi:hypothetical protein